MGIVHSSKIDFYIAHHTSHFAWQCREKSVRAEPRGEAEYVSFVQVQKSDLIIHSSASS